MVMVGYTFSFVMDIVDLGEDQLGFDMYTGEETRQVMNVGYSSRDQAE